MCALCNWTDLCFDVPKKIHYWLRYRYFCNFFGSRRYGDGRYNDLYFVVSLSKGIYNVYTPSKSFCINIIPVHHLWATYEGVIKWPLLQHGDLDLPGVYRKIFFLVYGWNGMVQNTYVMYFTEGISVIFTQTHTQTMYPCHMPISIYTTHMAISRTQTITVCYMDDRGMLGTPMWCISLME